MVATAVKVNEELAREARFRRGSTGFSRINTGIFSLMISARYKALLQHNGRKSAFARNHIRGFAATITGTATISCAKNKKPGIAAGL
jgi:hypothetical protein